MNIVETARKFVMEECKKPTSKYGFEPYEFHFVPMVRYADKLSDQLGGDKEIILVAGWLHDIGSIIDGRENHHFSGAKIAREFLQKHHYPADKIEKIANCILNHRGSRHDKRLTLEEKIVAEADILSNFENISGIFKAAYIYEGLDQGQAKEAVLSKLENKYKQLHFKESKKIIEPKYKAVKLLFGVK